MEQHVKTKSTRTAVRVNRGLQDTIVSYPQVRKAVLCCTLLTGFGFGLVSESEYYSTNILNNILLYCRLA